MKWIGQSIVDFIARFRNDVYLDSPTAGGSDPDKFLGIDSNNKIIYRTGAEVFSDIGAASGDITAVVAGTGLSGGATSGSATLNVSDLTVSEIAGATLITESDSIASNDNDTTLPTSAAVKLYADRPSQQIVLMRAGFKDDLGTTKHYVPLQSELEQTLYQHEMNGFVAPYNGKLLKLMYRGSGNFSGGDVAFTLEQIDRNEAFLTTPDVLETITVTGPTNTTTDPNMVTANFVGGSGTNTFVAGDHILIGMQFDTDVTASGSKHFITLVFEFDFSGVAQ